ncbi:MAG TPA: hypothetical protein VFG30_15180 [Polyangiales bacterium]|nr:hypothetical protein [Polyangiales bacterium]
MTSSEHVYPAEHGFPNGRYTDTLLAADGGVIWSTPWRHNLIVDRLSAVLAALIKGDIQAAALGYWAVGRGEESWDSGSVPSDANRRAYVQLVNETGRKPLSAGQIAFVGGSFTRQIEITAEFTAIDLLVGPPNQRLREFGLFAGGISAANSGWLINHRIHPRIDMQPGFTLRRTLRLTF